MHRNMFLADWHVVFWWQEFQSTSEFCQAKTTVHRKSQSTEWNCFQKHHRGMLPSSIYNSWEALVLTWERSRREGIKTTDQCLKRAGNASVTKSSPTPTHSMCPGMSLWPAERQSPTAAKTAKFLLLLKQTEGPALGKGCFRGCPEVNSFVTPYRGKKAGIHRPSVVSNVKNIWDYKT